MSVPVGERSTALVVPIYSDDESSSGSSSHSQHNSDSPDSSPGQRVHRLTCRIISSDPEEASEETEEGVTSTTAPEFPALRIAQTASMTQ